MASADIIAIPYAKAAFEFAKSHKKLAQWAAILQVTGEVMARDDIRSLLNHPAVGQDAIVAPMIEALGTACDGYQRNFLKLLAEKNRLGVLPAIAKRFHNEQLADAAVIQATVITADKVAEEILVSISKALETKTAQAVEVVHEIDDSLIGGAMIKMGDHVIDASLKGQLHRLAQQMIH